MPLLTTKLHVPPVRPRLVSRPRLIERLSGALDLKLTLVCAPAGFGKTTLLSEWAARCGRPVAWLSLDESDNDPARFLAYLIAALQGVAPGIGQGVLGALDAPQPPPVAPLLVGLINELAAAPAPFVLVLDDYHLVEGQAIHQTLAFLLDHQPPQMHLAISTRTDPPLPLARLRARGQMLELRQADLCFSADEAGQFLRQVMALDLPVGEVEALAARTEGWIAGLQMAGLSLQGCPDTAAFVRAFAGSDRYILDYLVEEVLQRQSERVQSFVLRASILERMSGPLCDAVLEAEGSAALLEQLERDNLFVAPLDNRREWYRAHWLFRDLLRRRLEARERERLAGLNERASRWYEEQGLPAEAIRHALQGQDWDRAARLAEQAAEPAMMRGEFAACIGWIEALPEEAIRARPRLGLYRIWGLLIAGRPLAEVESALREAEAGGQASEGALAALRSVLGVVRGDVAGAIDQAQRARRLLPEEDLYFRRMVVRSLGVALLYRGDAVGAQPLFEEDARVSRQEGDITGLLAATRLWAVALMARGRLRQARQAIDAAEPFLPQAPGMLHPAAIKLLVVHADLLRECNELDEAAALCDKALAMARAVLYLFGLGANLMLARVRQAQGRLDDGLAAIDEALRLAKTYDITDLDDALVYAYRARLFLAGGDLEAAAAWARECGLPAGTGGLRAGDPARSSLPYYVREIEQASLARVCLAQGRAEQALAVLRPLLATVEEQGRAGGAIEALALEALALQAAGQAAAALAALGRALTLAEPEGYVRTFADEGAPMARLLELAAGQGICPAYARRLLAVMGAPRPGRARPAAGALPEPLSDRELEVLRLLAAGLSNRDIAAELVITENTVRSHCKSIFGKLGAHKRWEAAHRAEELGLI